MAADTSRVRVVVVTAESSVDLLIDTWDDAVEAAADVQSAIDALGRDATAHVLRGGALRLLRRIEQRHRHAVQQICLASLEEDDDGDE